METVDAERQKLRDTFRTGKTKDYQWRMEQLGQMLKMINENRNALEEALVKDLGRHPLEAAGLDIASLEGQIKYMMKNLRSWMKPTMYEVEVLVAPALAETVQEPFGVCLIIAPFNYPINLMLLPLAGAIAAGNCAMLKPSELSPACEALNVELINKYMDTTSVSIVTGEVPIVQKLLSCEWDKIFFTGSVRVGKIVMKAAAEFLTPVSLELGGKSPCYIDNSVTDMKLVARRVMWGKTVNAGQTCIAPDYILCHEDVYDSFLTHAKQSLLDFYGPDPRTSDSFARIVSTGHAERLQHILNQKNGRIICGGGACPSDKYIEPTIIADVTVDSPVMQEELFGPILPVLKVKNSAEAIDIMHLHDKPLALYLFGKDRATFDRIMGSVTSGGVCVNDTLMHVLGNLPFGGVGRSGVGSYHGKFSFDDFSHMRAVMRRDDHMFLDAPQRYPPYTDSNKKFLLAAAGLPPLPAIHPKTFKIAVLTSVMAAVAFVCHRYDLFNFV